LFTTVVIAALALFGFLKTATFVALVLIVCAFLEVLFDFCIGCKLYYALQLSTHGGYRLAKDLKDITLKEIIAILETDTFSDIGRTDNMALKLFWEDIHKGIMDVFSIPLSELKNYQMKANHALNYSI